MRTLLLHGLWRSLRGRVGAPEVVHVGSEEGRGVGDSKGMARGMGGCRWRKVSGTRLEGQGGRVETVSGWGRRSADGHWHWCCYCCCCT